VCQSLYQHYWKQVLNTHVSKYWIKKFFLNKGRPTRWHLLYYVNLLLNMFQMLIQPSSGACDYLVRYCVGWLETCWCYVAGLSVGVVVSECRLNEWDCHYKDKRIKLCYNWALLVTISWLKVTENTTQNGIWWICGWIFVAHVIADMCTYNADIFNKGKNRSR